MNSLIMTVGLSGIMCFAIWPFAESVTLLALFGKSEVRIPKVARG